jgi:hypothetical protein
MGAMQDMKVEKCRRRTGCFLHKALFLDRQICYYYVCKGMARSENNMCV